MYPLRSPPFQSPLHPPHPQPPPPPQHHHRQQQQHPPPKSSSSSSRPLTPQDPDIPILQHILSASSSPYFSKMAIVKTDALPSHLHSLKRLALNDNSALHLQVSPPASVPLLRHERVELETEAISLQLLADAGLPVPAVIRHDKDASLLGAAFLLTTSLPGVPLAHILPSASRAERRNLDSQIDALEARLTKLSSTTFGPVTLVAKGEGFNNWPDAFQHMVALVLKDGEDVFVNLPYGQIRDVMKTRVAREALSEIKTARLCVGGLGGPEGVLVEGSRVVGLVGFKCVWWGDRALEAGGVEESGDKEGWEVVRKGGADARALLYACYHATVTIVTSFYRPGAQYNELDARRSLTASLSQLNIMNSR